MVREGSVRIVGRARNTHTYGSDVNVYGVRAPVQYHYCPRLRTRTLEREDSHRPRRVPDQPHVYPDDR